MPQNQKCEWNVGLQTTKKKKHTQQKKQQHRIRTRTPHYNLKSQICDIFSLICRIYFVRSFFSLPCCFIFPCWWNANTHIRRKYTYWTHAIWLKHAQSHTHISTIRIRIHGAPQNKRRTYSNTVRFEVDVREGERERERIVTNFSHSFRV